MPIISRCRTDFNIYWDRALWTYPMNHRKEKESMAGKHRRSFSTIIDDRISEHYRGRIPEKDLLRFLAEIRLLLGKLEKCKSSKIMERNAMLRKLKRLPLEKLQEFIDEDEK